MEEFSIQKAVCWDNIASTPYSLFVNGEEPTPYMQQSQQYKQTHPQLISFMLTLCVVSDSVIVSFLLEKTRSCKFAVKFNN